MVLGLDLRMYTAEYRFVYMKLNLNEGKMKERGREGGLAKSTEVSRWHQ